MNDKDQKHYKLIILFIAGSFVIVNLIFILFPGVFDILQLRLNDQLFKLRNSIKGPEEVWGEDQGNPLVILVELDDKGYDRLEELKEIYGDREFDADIINVLSAAGVESIGYDTVFAREGGGELIDATKNSRKVYYPIVLSLVNTGNNLSNSSVLMENTLNMKTSGKSLPEFYIRYGTKPVLAKESKGLAHINVNPDSDGIYRRIPLLMRTKDGYFPSLGLSMAMDYLQVGPDQMEVVFGSHILLKKAKYPDGSTRDIKIPVADQGEMIINYAGQWLDVYRHIAFVDILEVLQDEDLLDILKEAVAGGLVIVADVSSAGKDFEAVPMARDYPLSSVHANVLNSIITANFIYELSGWKQIVIAILIGFILCIIAIKTRALIFSLLTFLIFCFYSLFVAVMFVYGNTFINAIPTAIAVVFSFIFIAVYRYLKEEQEKNFLYQTFQSYFAPSVMNKILSDPEKLESSERKVLTVLFTDISGFTAWSSTREPEEIHSTLNEYYSEMARIVFKYEGTIDKYMGDGMMAFYGDPVDYDDHALRAVKTAIDMQRKARELSEEWKNTGKLQLQMRIGINTGDMVVGNMGSEDRIDYTVLGSNVNLAQRLEANAPIGGILISRLVYEHIMKEKDNISYNLNDIEILPYAKLSLDGFAEDIQVYQIKI